MQRYKTLYYITTAFKARRIIKKGFTLDDFPISCWDNIQYAENYRDLKLYSDNLVILKFIGKPDHKNFLYYDIYNLNNVLQKTIRIHESVPKFNEIYLHLDRP